MTSSLSGYGPTGRGQMGSATGDKIPKGFSKGSLQQFTPDQMKLFSQMFGRVSPDSYLSKLAGGDEQTFQDIEAPALRQFGELQGGLASRFSGQGGLGARRSSGFQNTMSQAASGLAQDLQGQRQGLQRQALMDLMGISGMLLGQRPQENFLVEKQAKPKSFLQQLLLGLSGGGGQAVSQGISGLFSGGF